VVRLDIGWMSMAEVWTEAGKRKSMSSSLLSVHHGRWLPSSKTGMFPIVSLNYSASCASLRGFLLHI
jgi:hypothetical protein